MLQSSCSKDDSFRFNFNARLCRLWSGLRVFLLAQSHKVDPWSIKDCIDIYMWHKEKLPHSEIGKIF